MPSNNQQQISDMHVVTASDLTGELSNVYS